MRPREGPITNWDLVVVGATPVLSMAATMAADRLIGEVAGYLAFLLALIVSVFVWVHRLTR